MSLCNDEVLKSSSKKLLTRNETAQMLGVSCGTLAVWVSTKRYNLTYTKIGRLVKYDFEDVLKFIESRKQAGCHSSCVDLIKQKAFRKIIVETIKQEQEIVKQNETSNESSLNSSQEIKEEIKQNQNPVLENGLFGNLNN